MTRAASLCFVAWAALGCDGKRPTKGSDARPDPDGAAGGAEAGGADHAGDLAEDGSADGSVQTCTDECGPRVNGDDWIVRGECVDGTTERWCGDWDPDPCLEWSAPARCQAADSCTNRRCRSAACTAFAGPDVTGDCWRSWTCSDTQNVYNVHCGRLNSTSPYQCEGRKNCTACAPACSWTTTALTPCESWRVAGCDFQAPGS